MCLCHIIEYVIVGEHTGKDECQMHAQRAPSVSVTCMLSVTNLAAWGRAYRARRAPPGMNGACSPQVVVGVEAASIDRGM